MLAEKMKEYEEYEELEENEVEEGFDTNEFGFDEEDQVNENEELEEDFDLSEILAELGDDDTLNEAEDEEEKEEKEEEEEEVADMSIDDLKALIADIVAQEMGEKGGEESEEEMPMDMGGEEAPAGDEEEINLDELLAELDALGESDDDIMEAKKKATKKEDEKKKKEDEKEMKEALDVINTLRAELNEVNLLNAKLLYVNKIFKAKNLSEDNKIKVINAFDKATTPNEAKLVFEALNESLEAKESSKSIVKEGIIKGFASKPAGAHHSAATLSLYS